MRRLNPLAICRRWFLAWHVKEIGLALSDSTPSLRLSVDVLFILDLSVLILVELLLNVCIFKNFQISYIIFLFFINYLLLTVMHALLVFRLFRRKTFVEILCERVAIIQVLDKTLWRSFNHILKCAWSNPLWAMVCVLVSSRLPYISSFVNNTFSMGLQHLLISVRSLYIWQIVILLRWWVLTCQVAKLCHFYCNVVCTIQSVFIIVYHLLVHSQVISHLIRV